MVYLIDISSNIGGLQATLQQVYDTLLVHCSDLIDVSRAIAAFVDDNGLWKHPDVQAWNKAAPSDEDQEAAPSGLRLGLAESYVKFSGNYGKRNPT